MELKRISTRAAEEVIWEQILRLRSWSSQAVESRAMSTMIGAPWERFNGVGYLRGS